MAMVIPTILSIPLIAMRFTEEVNWGLMDFVVAGILLFILGIVMDNIHKRIPSKHQRILWMILALFGFILIWMEMAVGIFGTCLAGD